MIYFARIEMGEFRIRQPWIDRWDSVYVRHMDRRPKRSIYFIKIGQSKDPLTRIKTLQVDYERTVKLLATMPGGPEEEGEMHRRFDHLRIETNGTRPPEWFHPVAELMDFIRSIHDSEKIPDCTLDLDMSRT